MLTGGGVLVFLGCTASGSLGNKGLGKAIPCLSTSADADGIFLTFMYRFRSTDAVKLIVRPAFARGDNSPFVFSPIAREAASYGLLPKLSLIDRYEVSSTSAGRIPSSLPAPRVDLLSLGTADARGTGTGLRLTGFRGMMCDAA